MLFNSVEFIVFFPAAVLLYFILPSKIRYIGLLFISYFFYMCWDPRFALLLIYLTVVTYVSGILIKRTQKGNSPHKQLIEKLYLTITIILCLGVLVYFKYTNFIISTFNSLFNLSIPERNLLVPVGISFITLQALSYPIDVYREDVCVEHNLLKHALFVAFFTNIASGPIERAKRLLPQLITPKKFNYDRFRHGFIVMLWGFFLKLVLADRIAIFVDTVYADINTYTGWYLIIATILYGVQIYCDFAGYSTIAIGAAEILGFDIIHNFNSPYLSKTCTEFWRRWHISLSSWFRDYLYIPLGGNRKGSFRKYINIMVVFLVSGLWHGALWTFIVWGAINGLYQIIGSLTSPYRNHVMQKLHIDKSCTAHRLLQVLFTFICIDFAWIFFRADSIQKAWEIIRSIFTADNIWVLFDNSIYKCGLDIKNFSLMIVSICMLLLVDYLKYKHIEIPQNILKQSYVYRWFFYVLLITYILLFGMWGPTYNAANFIYVGF